MSTDEVDEIIITCLSKNAKMSAPEIALVLKEKGINRTSRGVLERIHKLEKEKRINGYTLRTGTQNLEGKIIRLILISFKTSELFDERVSMFTSYLKTAPFVAFAARTRGQYDWLNVKVFPNTRIANHESDMYRTIFGDIIDRYVAFDISPVTDPDFAKATNYSIEDFYRFLEKWIKKSSETEHISANFVP